MKSDDNLGKLIGTKTTFQRSFDSPNEIQLDKVLNENEPSLRHDKAQPSTHRQSKK